MSRPNTLIQPLSYCVLIFFRQIRFQQQVANRQLESFSQKMISQLLHNVILYHIYCRDGHIHRNNYFTTETITIPQYSTKTITHNIAPLSQHLIHKNNYTFTFIVISVICCTKKLTPYMTLILHTHPLPPLHDLHVLHGYTPNSSCINGNFSSNFFIPSTSRRSVLWEL